MSTFSTALPTMMFAVFSVHAALGGCITLRNVFISLALLSIARTLSNFVFVSAITHLAEAVVAVKRIQVCPLSYVTGAHPLSYVTGEHPLSYVTEVHPLSSVTGAHPLSSVTGVHPSPMSQRCIPTPLSQRCIPSPLSQGCIPSPLSHAGVHPLSSVTGVHPLSSVTEAHPLSSVTCMFCFIEQNFLLMENLNQLTSVKNNELEMQKDSKGK